MNDTNAMLAAALAALPAGRAGDLALEAYCVLEGADHDALEGSDRTTLEEVALEVLVNDVPHSRRADSLAVLPCLSAVASRGLAETGAACTGLRVARAVLDLVPSDLLVLGGDARGYLATVSPDRFAALVTFSPKK